MSRRIIAVLISVVLAAVGAGAVLLYIRSVDSRAVAGKQPRPVLVAARQIPAGTSARVLKDKAVLRLVRMPAETVPDEALQNVGADLDALVTTATVQRGQLLLRSMFGTSVANGSGQVVPDGKILVPVHVKWAVFGPGAVRAGSKVAIFVTYTPDKDSNNIVSPGGLDRSRGAEVRTRLLLTDIEVISVDSGPASDTAIGRTGAANATRDDLPLTFAMTQEQAEVLAHVVALGAVLNLALLGDSSKVTPDDGVDNRSVFGRQS
jgi:pilus assembly protein CpaB